MPRKRSQSKHHPLETKLKAVNLVIDERVPRMEVAIMNKISLGTLNNWLKRYQIEGVAGLETKAPSKSKKETPIEELERLRVIEQKYYEAQEDIEILKKFRASLEASENQSVSKRSSR